MNLFLRGVCYEGQITKDLVKTLPSKSIVVLHHEDIDSTAADALIDKKVKAVINVKQSMTGKYDHNGVLELLQAQIPVYDIVEIVDRNIALHLSKAKIINNELFLYEDNKWLKVAKLYRYTFSRVKDLKKVAFFHSTETYKDFVSNSLTYADKELGDFLSEYQQYQPFSELDGKEVVIVVRGAKYKQDFQVVLPIIKRKKLPIIAVDGAADGLAELGVFPDYIIGDMDSVSERLLQSGAKLIAHCYLNGNSPGYDRVCKLGLSCEKLPFVGTSEDVAVIFSYWANAKVIYLVGGHNSMNDFLEKGRNGMGATLLTRMQAGHRIVDLKGIHRLRSNREKYSLPMYPIAGSIMVLLIMSSTSKIQLLFMILWNWIKVGG
ncbi:putative cytokinetic ring protein SteA [Alkalihalobacterium chitinilyticum]|uniref:Cytokinetic ring protein SteA n=1 Tax=Alkalihalobacterium chitinilyticum TaxID=2980103 RepID=A0ABT5VA66_9BACI|nr:putative cytokinetic ring protein SteA [Alkalihalobacterium chitinilyticum]MDE5412232.1 putative cytokinetic ring protein SteA [Alkalihalobacterium chitinilyticum]